MQRVLPLACDGRSGVVGAAQLRLNLVCMQQNSQQKKHLQGEIAIDLSWVESDQVVAPYWH